MNKQEKVEDVEDTLDGRISYTQLQNAKRKKFEARKKFERLDNEFLAIVRQKNAAQLVRDEAEGEYRRATSELENLVDEWKDQKDGM